MRRAQQVDGTLQSARRQGLGHEGSCRASHAAWLFRAQPFGRRRRAERQRQPKGA
jgi:hypothetical protein